MMDLYSSLIHRKTSSDHTLVDEVGEGRCLSERWWMKERIREWDGGTQWRVREIIFSSLSLSLHAHAPPQSSSCCHGNSHQIRTSAAAFISGCPQSAQRPSVYINCVMEHHRIQPLPAILIHSHIQQGPATTSAAEGMREPSRFKENKVKQVPKNCFSVLFGVLKRAENRVSGT